MFRIFLWGCLLLNLYYAVTESPIGFITVGIILFILWPIGIFEGENNLRSTETSFTTPKNKSVEGIINYLFCSAKVFIVMGGEEKLAASLAAFFKLSLADRKRALSFSSSFFTKALSEQIQQIPSSGQKALEDRLKRFEKEIISGSKISGSRKSKILMDELVALDPEAYKALESCEGNYYIKKYPTILGAQSDRNWYHLMDKLV